MKRKLFTVVAALLLSVVTQATTLFSDTFTRADNATVDATNWTENNTATWSILTNQVRGAGGGVGRALVTTTSAHAAVADVQVTVTRVANSAAFDAGLLCRTNSTATTGYFADVIGTGAGSTIDIWRIDGPAINNDTQIGSTVTGLNIPAGSVLKFKCQTNGAQVDLTGYVGGSQVISVSDTSGSRITAAGQTGIVQWDSSNDDWDNFLAEDLAAGGGVVCNPVSGRCAPAAPPITQFIPSPAANDSFALDAANDDHYRVRSTR